MVRLIICVTLLLAFSNPALAEDSGKSKKAGAQEYRVADQTSIDFSETLIEGKMKAPQGFFLQGRKSQSLSQMVRLRSHFRGRLRNSRAAVKALIK